MKRKKVTNSTYEQLPMWAQIQIGAICGCAKVANYNDEHGGLDFYSMRHSDTGEVGYAICWGDSRWGYLVKTPWTMDIYDLAKIENGDFNDLSQYHCEALADQQPAFNEDGTGIRALVCFLVEAAYLWLSTGEPLHYDCTSREDPLEWIEEP